MYLPLIVRNKRPHSIDSMQLFVLYVSLESPVQSYSFPMKSGWSLCWLSSCSSPAMVVTHSYLNFGKCFWSMHDSGTLFLMFQVLFSASLCVTSNLIWKEKEKKSNNVQRKIEWIFGGRKYHWWYIKYQIICFSWLAFPDKFFFLGIFRHLSRPNTKYLHILSGLLP